MPSDVPYSFPDEPHNPLLTCHTFLHDKPLVSPDVRLPLWVWYQIKYFDRSRRQPEGSSFFAITRRYGRAQLHSKFDPLSTYIMLGA